MLFCLFGGGCAIPPGAATATAKEAEAEAEAAAAAVATHVPLAYPQMNALSLSLSRVVAAEDDVKVAQVLS